MNKTSRILQVVLLAIFTASMVGCGGGSDGDSGQIDRPSSLSGSYEIHFTLASDTCGGAGASHYGGLYLAQSGNSISGTNASNQRVSGVISENPYGFVVENVELASRSYKEQTSVVYSESARQFEAIEVADIVENGKRCRVEYRGPVDFRQ